MKKPKRKRKLTLFITIGRLGGQSTSAAKVAAARRNGAKGGRPRTITAKEFDRKFDAGEDISAYVDWSKATRPGRPRKAGRA